MIAFWTYVQNLLLDYKFLNKKLPISNLCESIAYVTKHFFNSKVSK